MHPNERADAMSGRLQALEALPTLAGTRVRLRAVREDDADGLFALFSDERVMRWWSRPAMTGREEAVAYAAQMRRGFEQREVLSWVMADAGDDRCIGTTTLYDLRLRHLRCDVGYALRPDRWGAGFASEAVGMALDWAFGWLQMHRVGADIAPGNEASVALLVRLGFRYEGRLRECFSNQRELQDSLIYGLLAREWGARRGGS